MKDPYIWVVDDVIPKQKCKEIIDKFNSDKSPDKKKGSIGRGVDLLNKNSTDLLISGKDNWTDNDNYFRNLVNKLMQKYSNYITLTFNSFTSSLLPNFKSNIGSKAFIFCIEVNVICYYKFSATNYCCTR